MIDETSAAPRPRRSRWPVAAALTAVAVGALAVTVAVAGGFSGPLPSVAAPSGAPAEPAGVPSVEQGGSIVDAGWVAPTSQGGTKAPANGNNPGRASKRGGITITKIDGSRLALVTDDDWTRTIDAAGATITRDGARITLAELAVGDEIALRQKHQADGTFMIATIRVILPKVAGRVTDVASSSLTLATRDGTKVTVKLTSSTTYRLGKDAAAASVVAVGMQAVVTGKKAADGTLTATSVAVKASLIAGTVTATSATSITITTRDRTTVAVRVTSTTTFRVAGISDAAIKDVKVEMWIAAQGLRTDDGSFTASAVQAAAAGKHKGWGDWKPNPGPHGGFDRATPRPAGTQLPSSNG